MNKFRKINILGFNGNEIFKLNLYFKYKIISLKILKKIL